MKFNEKEVEVEDDQEEIYDGKFYPVDTRRTSELREREISAKLNQANNLGTSSKENEEESKVGKE